MLLRSSAGSSRRGDLDDGPGAMAMMQACGGDDICREEVRYLLGLS